MSRWSFLVLAGAIAALCAGCGSEKSKALEGLEKIKEACTANDKDLARQITDDLRAKNKTFDRAFDAAIDDKRSSVNICSPLLHNEVASRIEHGG